MNLNDSDEINNLLNVFGLEKTILHKKYFRQNVHRLGGGGQPACKIVLKNKNGGIIIFIHKETVFFLEQCIFTLSFLRKDDFVQTRE